MNRKSLLYGLMSLALLLVAVPGVAQESGANVWAQNCGRCHRPQPPAKYDADTWRAIVGHMSLYARLTADEEEAVREFLMGSARRLTQQEEKKQAEPARLASNDPVFVPVDAVPSGPELFARYCVACHGKQGKGDGPAAAALTPRPANLTDAALIGKLTDDELLQVLAKGKGSGMPGFAAQLSPEQLEALRDYVRGLSADKGGS